MRARDNPFATVHLHRIRYRFDGLTWGEFIGRLSRANHRGAIVGPEGAGKSTLLRELAPQLAGLGFEPVPLRLTGEAPRFPRPIWQELSRTLTSRHIVLLDGAEQMSRWGWWRFRRLTLRAGGLIITAHRTGLLPTLITCGTNLELLEALVDHLLGGDRSIPRAELEQLFVRHHGNIREALRELYDTCSAGSQETFSVRQDC